MRTKSANPKNKTSDKNEANTYLKKLFKALHLDDEIKELYTPWGYRFMNDAILLIGGNQGNRLFYLNQAIQEISKMIGDIELRSHIYETAPWGIREQPSFYNQALIVKTNLSPKGLLAKILSIEEMMGRKREEKYGPRIIDIDILYFGNKIIQEDQLEIPHPRIAERRFVLTPLAELNPEWVDPIHKKTIREMLESCNDVLTVDKLPPDCV